MDQSKAQELVKLNVGGTWFYCYRHTLNTFPESKLSNLDKSVAAGHQFEDSDGYFFDRNPALFVHILDGFRKGIIHLPRDVCGITLKDELRFWNIGPQHVAPCCLEMLYRGEDEEMTMKTLMDTLQRIPNRCTNSNQKPDIRTRIWLFLDEPKSSKSAMVWCVLISSLIIASALMEALATLSTFQMDYDPKEQETLRKLGEISGWDNSSLNKIIHMKPIPALQYGNFACHCILTLELIVCIFVCPHRGTYMKSPWRIIVFIGYISYWIDMLLELNFDCMTSVHALRIYLALRYMTILMLARLFYITNQIPSFQLIWLTFRFSKQELTILGFVLGSLVSVFGFIMFVAELLFNCDMGNVFTAMYWALITLTTVGYGRYYPRTVFGHFVAGACAVCGVIVLALPIGIIASTFYTFYSYSKYAKKHIRACKRTQRSRSCLKDQ